IREGATGTLCHGLAEHLAVGDIVRVAGPEGASYLRERHDGPVLAIAGGSGFAPIRSILGTLRARGLRNPVHAYFGARAERDVYGESELRSWTEGQPQSAAHVVLSVDGGRGRRHGFVTDAVAMDFDRLDGFKAYVAGPPAMVEAAVQLLQRKGMALRDIHTDLPVAVANPVTAFQESS
ncbi:MAG: naphthalene 1,2-dioxygenase, partial [Burkholderiales bacterium]|nr:naphthalene 1,2-dioxygenase [Burkholderiales bacterium]